MQCPSKDIKENAPAIMLKRWTSAYNTEISIKNTFSSLLPTD